MNIPNTIYRGRQKQNDEKNLEAIADEYEGKLGHKYWLADALQKDAIQNTWDAKSFKKAREWETKIELINTKNGKFLLIQDSGTSGLTGTIWKTDDELTDILNAKDKKENLAHFLSSNFSEKDSGSGGKRGRGKSLFLISSKDSAFYFDSIRTSDNLYVAGGVFLKKDRGVHIENSQERGYIDTILGEKFKTLSTPGTRVFIKNPKQELIEALRNGSMLDFIERTQWEKIKKYRARILINDSLHIKEASVPSWYIKDALREKGLEVREYPNLTISSPDGGKLRIKRIVLAYNPTGDTPEGIQGIAIQRQCMTIERRATGDLVKEEGMSKVHGWVEMEEPLESAMYDLEDVEHLGFKWRNKPAKDLLDVIKIKVREFAKEVKLIEGELSKEHKARKRSEDEVAKKINDFLKNLGFTGVALGKKRRSGGKRISNLPLRISLTDFKLPNDTRRVNFGDKIQACAIVINDLKIPLEMVHKTWIVDMSGNTVRIQNKKIHLHMGEKFSQGWSEIKVSQKEFPMGDYIFKSEITILKDTDVELPRIGRLEKATTILVSAAFSVEKDPPSHGFIKFEPIESDNKTKYVSARPESQFIVIEYNTKHPYIKRFMPADRQNELKDFLYQVGTVVAFNQVMTEDISQEHPQLFSDISEDYDQALILPRIMEEISKLMWVK